MFKPEVCGQDLKLAILRLMNKIKEKQEYPKSLELCNITSIYKIKGDKNNLNNYRGVFRVLIFRAILERLIYNDEYYTIDDNLTDANVGGRKHRNIRDNLFVVNAIMNSVKKGSEESLDICAYDVEKCFDSLWTYECINDLYEDGLRNDKLTLLFNMNQHAQIAIKTPLGLTERQSIENVIMQGTVWGSLFCTSTVDKLAKRAYQDPTLLYKYKGEVDVPPLQMVDDILTVQKCGTAGETINTEVNAFISQKKLTLGHTKCVKVHIGKKCKECDKLLVHNETMKESHQVKYLGDVIHEDGRPRATILERVNRGWAICGQIFGFLKDIPIGNLRVQIGLELRKSWLINGIFYNSEVWYGLNDSDMANFVIIDQYLIRGLMNSHSKTPIEHLYLETAALPIKYIILSRRLIYLKEILDRPDTELVKKIYRCQQANPVPGDWSQLIAKDFQDINLNISENSIESLSVSEYKKLVKTQARSTAFDELEALKDSHSKVELNKYINMNNPQGYITSESMTNKQISILFALRSHSLRGIKENFKKMYLENTLCPICERFSDSQYHTLKCQVPLHIRPLEEDVDYNPIYGTTQQQEQLVKVYKIYLGLRDELLDDISQDQD